MSCSPPSQATGLSQTDAAQVQSRADNLPAQSSPRSPLMQAVFRDTSLIAPSESRVLITGESGVGKEILADVIHAWSPRAAGPLVKVNCAAIPETLLESELFGHEKGSFTGAIAQRIGRFEMAEGGTIFLDEIAEMSPQLQAKLLRVTQDGRFQRIGSNTEMHATRASSPRPIRNLEEEVKAGRFREDLLLSAERGGVEHPAVARAARRHFAAGAANHRGVHKGKRAAFAAAADAL